MKLSKMKTKNRFFTRGIALFLTVMFFCAALIPKAFAANRTGSAGLSQTEEEILLLLNEERQSAGLTPLSVFPALQNASAIRAKELVTSFSHTRPDGSVPFTALDAAGVSYRYAGENIAAGYKDAVSVVQAWMQSQGHRENILNGNFAHVGVSMVQEGANGYSTSFANLFVGGCAAQSLRVSEAEITCKIGTQADALGLYVTATCAAHGESYLPLTGNLLSGFDTASTGTRTVTVSLGEARTTFVLHVIENNSVPTPTPSSSFSDVKSDDWYAEAVQSAVSRGYLNGMGDGTFAPNAPLTRAMTVTILGRMAGANTNLRTDHFTDVAQDAWYAPYVAWGEQCGIVMGMGDRTFAPDAPVTREQFAVFVKRFSEACNRPLSNVTQTTFTDASTISDWAKEAVQTVANAGLLTGRPGGIFDPHASLSRAEAATILTRMS